LWAFVVSGPYNLPTLIKQKVAQGLQLCQCQTAFIMDPSPMCISIASCEHSLWVLQMLSKLFSQPIFVTDCMTPICQGQQNYSLGITICVYIYLAQSYKQKYSAPLIHLGYLWCD
jgi:hypothetical protein